MKIGRWLALLPVSMWLTLATLVLAPFLSLYSVCAGINVLPGRWQWFSTTDTSLDGGFTQGGYPSERMSNPFWLWWYRTCWIWRNPSYGWETQFLGCNATGITTTQHGSDETIESTWYTKRSAEGYWCTRGLYRLGRLGIRFGFGWKLEQGTQPYQYVCSLALRWF